MPKSVSVEDTIAVQDLLGRYCWYVDEGQSEEWASLYTEDGVFEGTTPEPVCGYEALKQIPAGFFGQSKGSMRHQYSSLYVDYGDDTNTLIARFYNQISNWKEGGSLVIMALSTATLVRGDAKAPWRIKKNSIKILK